MHSSTHLSVSAGDRGFTMIELMIVVTLIAIGLTIGAPYVRDAMMNVRMTAQANDLMADLALARSEAGKRKLTVYLCTSTNGTDCAGTNWANGWLVFPDLNSNGVQDPGENALKGRAGLGTGNTIQACGDTTPGARYLPYRPTGLSSPGGATFIICDSRTVGQVGRQIDIGPTGRPNVSRITCPANTTCT